MHIPDAHDASDVMKVTDMIAKLEESFLLLENRIQLLGLKNTTIDTYRYYAEHLSRYMADLETEDYSCDVGQEFLVFCQETLRFNVSNMNNAKNFINKLNGTIDKNQFWIKDYSFNSYVLKNSLLTTIFEQMTTIMHKFGHGKWSFYCAKRCINSLDIYMAENGIPLYTTDVGQAFLDWVQLGSNIPERRFKIQYSNYVDVIDDLYASRYPNLHIMVDYKFDNDWVASAASRLKERLVANNYSKNRQASIMHFIYVLDYYVTLQGLDGLSEEHFEEFYKWCLECRPMAKDKKSIKAAISHISDILLGKDYFSLHHKYVGERTAPEGFRDSFNEYIQQCIDGGGLKRGIFPPSRVGIWKIVKC